MSDTISSLLQILLMAAGGHGADWGDQTNTNLQKLEAAIAGQLSITTTGGTITLTADQARNGTLAFNGALASNLIIVVPALSKGWTILNQTTGTNTVTLKSAAGGTNTITIPANSCALYYCDGTLVYSVAQPLASETGIVKIFAGPSANVPVNYLLCYGQAVSRTTYATLFATISTTYGVGDGSTTFNLPDYRGITPVGLDNMGGVAAGRVSIVTPNLGQIAGEQVHILTLSEIPAHAHGVTDPGHAHSITDPGHNHTVSVLPGVNQAGFNNSSPGGTGGTTFNTSSSTTGISVNGAGTGISIQNSGGGLNHNNLQPMMFQNFIIRI